LILAKENIGQIYDGLKYNFLYNNDINSIHILLNLYDLEDNMVNICPKYITTQEIRKKIRRLLVYKKSRQLISNNIVLLIHEDIDRLELIMHLEGYKYSYYNNKWVNILEDAALKYYTIEEIYDSNFLFHHNTNFAEIAKIKQDLELEIRTKEKESNSLTKVIYTYCEKVIKNKIYNLDKYTDKQLAIECNSDKMDIREEEPYLSLVELNKIYNTIVKTITKNAIISYESASWFGINDKVLNRYR
jgi:hypothetical protein